MDGAFSIQCGRRRPRCNAASMLPTATDSTRLVTFHIDVEGGVPPIAGVEESRRNVSHHGQDGAKIEQLRRVERAELQVMRDFVGRLKRSDEAGGSVLERTMVLYGSNLGNASSHNTQNLPILLFGGGFKHGQHLAFDGKNNTPLGRYLSPCCNNSESRKCNSPMRWARCPAWSALESSGTDLELVRTTCLAPPFREYYGLKRTGVCARQRK